MVNHPPLPPMLQPDPPNLPHELDAPKLTWAVVLGRWVEFAKAAVALPTEGEGGRWRAAVPHIIQLQAVWFALGQLDELDRSEQHLGLDRAAVLRDRHAQALRELWEPDPLPVAVAELLEEVDERLSC